MIKFIYDRELVVCIYRSLYPGRKVNLVKTWRREEKGKHGYNGLGKKNSGLRMGNHLVGRGMVIESDV